MNLQEYTELQEICGVLQGQIDETHAKTKLLRNRLALYPEIAFDISQQIENLEREMIAHLASIKKIDAQL